MLREHLHTTQLHFYFQNITKHRIKYTETNKYWIYVYTGIIKELLLLYVLIQIKGFPSKKNSPKRCLKFILHK